MTPAQKMMIQDGLPACLILTQAERKAAWDKNPPKSYSFTDPRIEQDRQLRIKQKQESTQKRIDALRQSKGLNPIYNNATNSTQPQESSDMPKFVIKPLDKHGAPVIRGMTSIKDDATQAEIYEKVLACVKRGGSKVATVLLEGADGKPTKAWTVGENEVASCDVTPYLPASVDAAEQAEVDTADAAPALEVEVTKEADMAKKAKAKTKKAPKAKAEKGYKGHRIGSRKEKAHRYFDELGAEKAKPKVIAMGIAAGTCSSWFGSFKKK